MNLHDVPDRPLRPRDRDRWTPDELNALQAELESRARAEADTGDKEFREWLYDQADDLVDITCCCVNASESSIEMAQKLADILADQYVAYRVNAMHEWEIERIAAELFARADYEY